MTLLIAELAKEYKKKELYYNTWITLSYTPILNTKLREFIINREVKAEREYEKTKSQLYLECSNLLATLGVDLDDFRD